MKSTIFTCIVMFAITCVVVSSCFRNYYMAPSPIASSNTVDSVINNQPQRIFILRAGAYAYVMNDIVVSEDKKTLVCLLNQLPEEHKHHVRTGGFRYKKNKPEAAVLNEVHMYSRSKQRIDTKGNYKLQLDHIEKIEVIEKNRFKTTVSYVLGVVGTTYGALNVAAIIALASNSPAPL